MFIHRTLRSIKFLFMAPVILTFLAIVNWMTYTGEWWIKWAALGIGLAWVMSLFRVIRAALLVGGIAALVAYLRRKP